MITPILNANEISTVICTVVTLYKAKSIQLGATKMAEKPFYEAK